MGVGLRVVFSEDCSKTFEDGCKITVSSSGFADMHKAVMESVPIGATGFCNLDLVKADRVVYSYRIYHNGKCDKATPDTSFTVEVLSNSAYEEWVSQRSAPWIYEKNLEDMNSGAVNE